MKIYLCHHTFVTSVSREKQCVCYVCVTHVTERIKNDRKISLGVSGKETRKWGEKKNIYIYITVSLHINSFHSYYVSGGAGIDCQ